MDIPSAIDVVTQSAAIRRRTGFIFAPPIKDEHSGAAEMAAH
jgi:hypothetical protein